MISGVKVGWGFEFTLKLIDKSGRSAIARKWITYRHRGWESATYEAWGGGAPHIGAYYTGHNGLKNTMGIVWVTTIHPR